MKVQRCLFNSCRCRTARQVISRGETNFPRGAITPLIVFVFYSSPFYLHGWASTERHVGRLGQERGKKRRNFKERTKRSPGDGLSGDLFKVPRPFDNQRAAIVTPDFEERWGRSEKGTKRGWGTMEEDPGETLVSPFFFSFFLSLLFVFSFSLVSRTACPEEKKSPMEIRDFKGHAIPRSKLKKDRENIGKPGICTIVPSCRRFNF